MQGLAAGRLGVETQGAGATGGQGEGAVWLRACADMRSELGDAAYGSYLAPARLRRLCGGELGSIDAPVAESSPSASESGLH